LATAMGCRTPIRQIPSGILFLKVSVLFGKSEFANPLSDFYLGKMCCRTPIRQIPSGILFFKGLRSFWQMLWVAELRFGKFRQAYFFLKDCVLFGNFYGLLNSDSANSVRDTFFKGLRSFWQLLWVAELRFGKCRQGYFFLKNCVLFGKERICQPIN